MAPVLQTTTAVQHLLADPPVAIQTRTPLPTTQHLGWPPHRHRPQVLRAGSSPPRLPTVSQSPIPMRRVLAPAFQVHKSRADLRIQEPTQRTSRPSCHPRVTGQVLARVECSFAACNKSRGNLRTVIRPIQAEGQPKQVRHHKPELERILSWLLFQPQATSKPRSSVGIQVYCAKTI